MTEDEAQMKQCCGPDPCGHFNDNPYPARWCNTTACMAWRWVGYRSADGTWVRKAPDGQKWNGDNADGYCGLAGAPK